MKPFFATVFGGLALGFLLVFYVDPRHLFHRERLPEKPPLHGEGMPISIFFKYGPRPLKLAHITYIEPPDLVLLGSSRTMLANSHMVSPSLKFFNFSVDGAKYTDYVGFWEALNEAGKRPRYLVLVPDGYAINGRYPGGVWLNTLKYFDRFIDKDAGPVRRGWDHLMEVWYALNESITWEMFRDSTKAALHVEPIWDMRGITKEDAAQNAVPQYLGDGGITEFPVKTKSEQLAQARFYGNLGAGLYSTIMYPWTPNPKAIQAMDRILKDAHQKGTRVMIIIPPFHPQTFKTISTLGALSGPFAEYRSIFKNLAAENPGTAFCDVMDPARLNCTEDDFVDALHMVPRCVETMIRSCFTDQGWSDLLPTQPHKT